jgi:hypothetical protein
VSYLHCPTCACAYNLTREPACPRCGVKAGTPADPTEDILSAVEQLARAMARATPVELLSAQSILDARDAQLALPPPGDTFRPRPAPSPQLLRAVRAALDPAPPEAPPSVLAKLFERLSPERRASWRAAIDNLLARLAPRLPEKTGKQSRRQAMFLFAKSQLTRFHQASMNFGRALR